ncbi:pyruvate dehydrogenase E1 component beta subunit [Sporobacter termitidis DSM 10068]|uniref:Pyruvate dehydrogenase E1 component beta subunit n=1 Tax=Sporobacter termitidis DSM 10068 TaxID=1123282 RepID=A0A1M5YS13_9FIRM|nr:alpha-ketoacid dehydrogenase subunit beta [Sporobacter termitidis]SHI14393.1 pyruvate dehydrogenase E1 component beta subunit [Sporobacter termitidis DSM 10068]
MAKIITYTQAIREAQDIEMARDSRVFICGEDVGVYGTAFGQTVGLMAKYGPMRVLDTPLSETAITSLGVGAAAVGLRPIVVHDFMDFMGVCMDEVLNQASKLAWMVGGQTRLSMVIRTQAGAGINAAAQHSQSLESFFTHMPGMKVVASSNPADMKGLLESAIRDDNPVIVLENKTLLGMEGEVPEGEYLVPIGKANIAREGSDVTIVSYGMMVNRCLAAAETLAAEGIRAEVIDLRSLVPLDKDAIFESIAKTNRLLIAHEAIGFSGYGAEIAALVAEEALDYLDAPIKRVTAPFTHCPFSPPLENAFVPNEDKIIQAVKTLM